MAIESASNIDEQSISSLFLLLSLVMTVLFQFNIAQLLALGGQRRYV